MKLTWYDVRWGCIGMVLNVLLVAVFIERNNPYKLPLLLFMMPVGLAWSTMTTCWWRTFLK